MTNKLSSHVTRHKSGKILNKKTTGRTRFSTTYRRRSHLVEIELKCGNTNRDGSIQRPTTRPTKRLAWSGGMLRTGKQKGHTCMQAHAHARTVWRCAEIHRGKGGAESGRDSFRPVRIVGCESKTEMSGAPPPSDAINCVRIDRPCVAGVPRGKVSRGRS